MAYRSEIHHRRSIRMRTHDYAQAGAYFVTICTYERACILDNPSIRTILALQWKSIGRYAKQVRGADFVVMPNHVHGIIWIERALVGAQHTGRRNAWLGTGKASNSNGGRPTARAAPLPASGSAPVDSRGSGEDWHSTGSPPAARAAPLQASGSLGAIVRGFKSSSAKRINEMRRTPGARVWQQNYYERVIRDEDELARVRQYIHDNPAKWAEDEDNPANFSAGTPVGA